MLYAQPRRLTLLCDLFACFFEQTLGFGQGAGGLGGLDGSCAVQSADEGGLRDEAHIQEDAEYLAHSEEISTVEIYTEGC